MKATRCVEVVCIPHCQFHGRHGDVFLTSQVNRMDAHRAPITDLCLDTEAEWLASSATDGSVMVHNLYGMSDPVAMQFDHPIDVRAHTGFCCSCVHAQSLHAHSSHSSHARINENKCIHGQNITHLSHAYSPAYSQAHQPTTHLGCCT